MNQFYLLDYLKKEHKADNDRLDLLKYELDQRVSYYGQHFRFPKEKEYNLGKLFYWYARGCLKNVYTYYLIIKNKRSTNKKTIISNSYFSVNKKLVDFGFNVLRPIHNTNGGTPAGNLKILREFNSINKIINNGSFNYLLSDNFFKKIDLFSEHLEAYYKLIDVAALIIPNDIAFFEQLNIRVFKKLGKPSFIFSHGGPPARYNIYDENQTDYLIVWGDKVKQHYIKAGFKPNKIIISGHPFYEKLSVGSLRYSFENVLILSKTLCGARQRVGGESTDRGDLITYVKHIEAALKMLGVEKARLRVHPSENIHWYLKFIDNDFFIADEKILKDSLEESTLVIGPTSTVFLESLYYGVNYLVYEPTVNGVCLSGYPPVPPFDGSDPKVPVAKNEVDLARMLKEKTMVDKTVFNDYIETPFNMKDFVDRI